MRLSLAAPVLAGLLAFSGCAAHPAAKGTWTLSSPELELRLSSPRARSAHRVEVTDRRTGRTWTGDSPMVLTSAAAAGDGALNLRLRDPNNGRTYAATMTMGPRAEVAFAIDADDPKGVFRGLHWPPSMRADLAGGHLLLCDRSAGMYIDQGDTHFHDKTFTACANTGALDMPWIGVTDAVRGDGMMVIFDSWVEAAARLDPDPAGDAWPQPAWFETRGSFGPTRRMHWRWIESGGHVAQAKAWRDLALANGQILPLRDRVAERPRVDWLRGAAIIWGAQGESLAREFHAHGIRRAVVNGQGRIAADDIRQLTELGFLSGEYDGYTDITEGPTGVHKDRIDEAAVRGPDGQPMLGWRTAAGTQYYTRSSAMYRRAAEIILPAVFSRYPYTARFFDVVPSLTLMEDYHPDRAMTRTDDMRLRLDLLHYARSFGIVTGGEHPKAWAAPALDYGEGNMSGPYWWQSSKVGQLARYDSLDEVPADHIRYGLDEAMRVPLWELTFHEALVSSWYWGDSNGWLYHLRPELSDRKDAANVLYGTAPLMWADHLCYGWDRNRARFLQTYHNICHFTAAVQFEEMTSHEFLSPDRLVQRTRFANGAVAVANFGKAAAEYRTDAGEVLMLAPEGGFHATAPGVEQSRVATDAGIVTRVLSNDFALVDSPTRIALGPLTASGTVWVTRMDEHRWNVVATTADSIAIDLAALGRAGATARVLAIDERGTLVDELAVGRSGDTLTLPTTNNEQRLFALILGSAADAVLATPDGGNIGADTPIALRAGRTGAAIRYTLDGSEPTRASALYAAPLTLANSAQLRARAFVDGQPVGAMATFDYTVTRVLVDTGVVRGGEAARELSVPLAGVRRLRLVIDDAADSLDFDTVLLGDPVLVRADGTRHSLLDLEPALAVQSSDAPNFDPDEAFIQGRSFERGILTHSHATFIYDLGEEYERLEIVVGIEDVTANRGSVRCRFIGTF